MFPTLFSCHWTTKVTCPFGIFWRPLVKVHFILHGVPCNPEQDALQNLEQRLDAELAKVREREPTPTVLKAEGGVSSDLFARPRLRPTTMQADRRGWGEY